MRDQRPQETQACFRPADRTQRHDGGIADGTARMLEPLGGSRHAPLAIGREGRGRGRPHLRVGVLQQVGQLFRGHRRPDRDDTERCQPHRRPWMAETAGCEGEACGLHDGAGTEGAQCRHDLLLAQELDQLRQEGHVALRAGSSQGDGHQVLLRRCGGPEGRRCRLGAGDPGTPLQQEAAHEGHGRVV